jgi:phosphoribosyl 1,2-cyclic phosphodiesterase
MRIRFWGTRGSLPKPGPTTLRYGGNTPCVEIRPADESLIVLDCGTGAQNLGEALAASGAVRGHLLITHMHWDHIQGLPFFAPLFAPGNEWDIYGPGSLGQRLQEVLEGQMAYPYFPIALHQFGATIRYHDLGERAFHLGSVRVTPRYLNHPTLTLGYRLDTEGVSVVYATDHEPHAPYQSASSTLNGAMPPLVPVHREDQEHIAFLAGADLVIHDAQYTLEEYQQRLGWGHSPVEYVVDVALAARVKRLALFHHEPWHDDATLDRLVEVCRQRVAACAGTLHVFAAAEGQTLELPERTTTPCLVDQAVSALAPGRLGAVALGETVLIVDDEPHMVHLLTAALRLEGYRVLTAHDADTALRLARAERPSLILLDWRLSGCDGLAVCRALRAEGELQFRQVPVVLLTRQAGVEDIAAGFAAGASDYLIKPCKPTYVRSRVCGWLMRTSPDTAGGHTPGASSGISV